MYIFNIPDVWGGGGGGCHSLKCYNLFYAAINNYLIWPNDSTSFTIITMKRRILTLPLDSVSPLTPVSTIKITQNMKITNLESISNSISK